MGYNLTIDQGNSSAKVAVWHDETMIYDSVKRDLSASDIAEITSLYPINAAIYCSVAQNGDAILAELQNRCGKVYELTSTLPTPITIDYRTPQSLGRDRIAAAVGAWTMCRGKWTLVVDLGTAITYDVVSPDGRFIGGNIAPGVEMRLEALHRHTARLPRVKTTGDCPLWGYDTETALRSGAINGIIGELHHYRDSLSNDTIVVLTGGSAEIIASRLDFPTKLERHLVTKGLNSILIYNENK
jgi:type III pantothenate kinase